MNIIFAVVILSSLTVMTFADPDGVLPALLSGAKDAGVLCVALLSSYCLWLGVMRVWEKSGVTSALSYVLKKPVKKLFKIESDETAESVCMNLSANLLGIGSIATPYGVKSVALMEKERNREYATDMLLVVNAGSLQLIPTSVISMRVAMGSASPYDIILPTLLCTLFSFSLGVLLVRSVHKIRKKQGGRVGFPTRNPAKKGRATA